MKFVIQKASVKPYTRVRRGKFEHVKGYDISKMTQNLDRPTGLFTGRERLVMISELAKRGYRYLGDANYQHEQADPFLMESYGIKKITKVGIPFRDGHTHYAWIGRPTNKSGKAEVARLASEKLPFIELETLPEDIASKYVERTVVPETTEVVRPFKDANKLKALSYVKNLKNPDKKDYAYSYFQFLMDGGTGNPPENPNIGAMGKQAVRMRLNEILSKSFLQDAMKIINSTPFASKKAKYDDIKMVLDVIKQEEDYDGENRGDDSKDSKEFHSDVFEAEDDLINFIQSELGEEGEEAKEGEKEKVEEEEEGEAGLEEGLELPEGVEEPPVPPAIGYKQEEENKKPEEKKEKKPEEEEVKKSGGKCPFDGKQGVYLRRFYQSPYWMREYKCPKGHVFTEVQ